jgi:prolyl-tRNA synthetase
MPIYKKSDDSKLTLSYCGELKETLQNGGIRSKVNARDEPSVGRRFNEWEVKGVPLRFEVGQREIVDRSVTVVVRDTGEKVTLRRDQMLVETEKMLASMQERLFHTQKEFVAKNTHDVDNYEKFKEIMETSRGYLRAFWCEDIGCEAKIKEETKATTRCLPLDSKEEKGTCILCGKQARHRWLFAQAY